MGKNQHVVPHGKIRRAISSAGHGNGVSWPVYAFAQQSRKTI